MKKSWEQNVDDALNNLDGIQRASANPYLYTRIMARLEEQHSKWGSIANFMSRPVIALTLSAFFVGINTWVVIKHPLNANYTKRSAQTELTLEPEYATVNYSLGDINSNDK